MYNSARGGHATQRQHVILTTPLPKKLHLQPRQAQGLALNPTTAKGMAKGAASAGGFTSPANSSSDGAFDGTFDYSAEAIDDYTHDPELQVSCPESTGELKQTHSQARLIVGPKATLERKQTRSLRPGSLSARKQRLSGSSHAASGQATCPQSNV